MDSEGATKLRQDVVIDRNSRVQFAAADMGLGISVSNSSLGTGERGATYRQTGPPSNYDARYIRRDNMRRRSASAAPSPDAIARRHPVGVRYHIGAPFEADFYYIGAETLQRQSAGAAGRRRADSQRGMTAPGTG